MGEKQRILTIKEMRLQILTQTQMRGLQRLLQLREPVPIVFALEIALDGLHARFQTLHSSIEACDHLVEFAEDVCVAGVGLGILGADVADDGIGCVVDLLNAVA